MKKALEVKKIPWLKTIYKGAALSFALTLNNVLIIKMSMINWGGNNNSTIDRLERRMNNFFDRFLDSTHDNTLERFNVGQLNPAVDVTESDTAYNIHADLPGVRKEDIHVDVHGNSLTFSGESKDRSEYSNDNVRYSERRFGKFSRTIPIPDNVDTEKIQAKYDNGVLNLKLPKGTPTSSKRINVT